MLDGFFGKLDNTEIASSSKGAYPYGGAASQCAQRYGCSPLRASPSAVESIPAEDPRPFSFDL